MIDARDSMTAPAFIAWPKSTSPKKGKAAREEIKKIVNNIKKFDTIEDVKENGETQKIGLRPEHLDALDCTFKPFRGERSIRYMAHLKMMAVAQPFINGVISKTVNLPKECTAEDITNAFIQALKLGLKSVAIYRNGSQRSPSRSTSPKQ